MEKWNREGEGNGNGNERNRKLELSLLYYKVLCIIGFLFSLFLRIGASLLNVIY